MTNVELVLIGHCKDCVLWDGGNDDIGPCLAITPESDEELADCEVVGAFSGQWLFMTSCDFGCVMFTRSE